ncbi:MAG: proteasome assembly chaperone family protein [Salinirussus sp.]
MNEFEIAWEERPELEAPVLIEGLPGVGHVGKLAAEYLIEELGGELVCRFHSTHFPPQVTVTDGVAELAGAELHAITTDDVELLVLTGDHQAGTPEGHYGLTEMFLDAATDVGTERVIALGGVPTGELIQEYDVVGAVTDAAQREELEAAGVEFREDEPAGGIVGVSGLLLGLGGRRGLDAACLMGETSGYLVDPKSARAVIETLQELIGFEVDFSDLEEQAEEMEAVVRQMEELEGAGGGGGEDLRYIG